METHEPRERMLSIEDVSRATGKSCEWVLVQIVVGRLDAVESAPGSDVYVVSQAALSDFASRFLGYL